MKCGGLHCPGCGHHGGNSGIGAAALIALILLAVTAANRRAIGHAAGAALHVLEVAAAIAAGLAAVIAVTAAVVAIRRRAPRRATANTVSARPGRAEIPVAVRVLAPATRAPAALPAPATFEPSELAVPPTARKATTVGGHRHGTGTAAT